MLGAKFLYAINKSKSHDCKRNMSPILVKFIKKSSLLFIVLLRNLDKTRVKLFPNFNRSHLITHTNQAVM